MGRVPSHHAIGEEERGFALPLGSPRRERSVGMFYGKFALLNNRNGGTVECPLWVISGHSAIPSPMSAIGG